VDGDDVGNQVRYRRVAVMLFQIPKGVALLTVIVIAFDVVALAMAAARVERKTSARRTVAEALSPPAYHILVLDPDRSAQRTMPCLQQRDADSTEYAAFPDPSQSPCHVAGLQTRPPNDEITRSYGRW
jgi:HAMP domain-containing protein